MEIKNGTGLWQVAYNQRSHGYARVKSRTTLMKWIKNGYIYAHKRSGEWIVDKKSIDDWYLSERV